VGIRYGATLAVAMLTLTGCTGHQSDPTGDPTGGTRATTPAATSVDFGWQHTELEGYFSDGIAPDEYPPVAQSRGAGYPEALEMEDWVWDRVGPTWALVLYAGSPNVFASAPEFAKPELDLVSPEGVHFALPELTIPGNDWPMLASWREESREAVVTPNGYGAGVGNYLVGLDSGAGEQVVLPRDYRGDDRCSQEDWGYPVGAGASGRELWGIGPCVASDGLEYELYFQWTASDGWVRAFPDPQDVSLRGFTAFPRNGGATDVSPDGSSVVFQVTPIGDTWHPTGARSGPEGVPRVLVYSLETGENRVTTPTFPASETDVPYYQGWFDSSTILFQAGGGRDDAGRSYGLSADGSPATQLVDPDASLTSALGRDASVSPNGWPFTLVSERSDYSVYEVRMTVDGREVVAASWRDYLRRQGERLTSAEELAPGVFRVTMEDGTVLGLDTVAGEVAPYVSARDGDGGLVTASTHVFYGEGTPRTWR